MIERESEIEMIWWSRIILACFLIWTASQNWLPSAIFIKTFCRFRVLHQVFINRFCSQSYARWFGQRDDTHQRVHIFWSKEYSGNAYARRNSLAYCWRDSSHQSTSMHDEEKKPACSNRHTEEHLLPSAIFFISRFPLGLMAETLNEK